MTEPFANPQRGEITHRIAGKTRRLCLTLGSVAEMEARRDDGFLTIVSRFEQGEATARDVLALLDAGFRGAGENVDTASLGPDAYEEGISGAYRLAAQLLRASLAPEAAAPPFGAGEQ